MNILDYISIADIINIAAIILAPVISVIIGQKLLDRSRKRDDKMQIFKTLMVSRIYGWTNASVEALNLIEVVFAKDKKVIKQWKKYYDVLSVEKPDASQREKMIKERDALLETMAISLGYKDNVTLRTIQDSYQPVGLADMLKKQERYQDNQLELMERFMSLVPKANTEATQNGQTKNGNP